MQQTKLKSLTSAIWPDRVLWIEAHDLVPDHVDQRRERHRRARMAGLRLLDCIDGKRADRIDRELIEFFRRTRLLPLAINQMTC